MRSALFRKHFTRFRNSEYVSSYAPSLLRCGVNRIGRRIVQTGSGSLGMPLLICFSREFSSTTDPLFQSSLPQNATAMDVAIQVNKLKKAHQGGAGGVKKEIELEAWQMLQNGLSEENIDSAEGKAVALLLNSWAYFAKHWEKGKDGPLIAEDKTQVKESLSNPETENIPS